ncbi:hypothetical protein FHT71_000283 [Rhizobium sp. BK060]|nr:hypothetical protein [Rhizobium sp. BK060]
MPKKKRPPEDRRTLEQSKNFGAMFALTANRCPGNAADIRAIDAEIEKLSGAHAAEFGDRLTVLAPIVERACYIHDKSPFLGFRSTAASPWRFVCFDGIDIGSSLTGEQHQELTPPMQQAHSNLVASRPARAAAG